MNEKLSQEEIIYIKKCLDAGKTSRQIAKRLSLSLKKVVSVEDEHLFQQVSASPRYMLARMVINLNKMVEKSLLKYKDSSHSQDAFALTNIAGDLRQTLTQLQDTMDVKSLSLDFIEILSFTTTSCIKLFVEEVAGMRSELQSKTDESSFRVIEDTLLSGIENLKGSLPSVYEESISLMEKEFSVNLDEVRDELDIERSKKTNGRKKKKINY